MSHMGFKHLTACGGGQQAGHIYDATKMTSPFCCRSYQSPSQLIPRSVLRIQIRIHPIRIQNHTKISWIRNTDLWIVLFLSKVDSTSICTEQWLHIADIIEDCAFKPPYLDTEQMVFKNPCLFNRNDYFL
jgi:hypothetical protein